MIPPPCAAAFPHAGREARAMPALWLLPSSTIWVGFAVIAVLLAWRIRDRSQVRRQLELQLAVRHRTDQLERGQVLDCARNRILEMLVSNEPLEVVLEAIARMVCDQMRGAHCVLLLKEDAARLPGLAALPTHVPPASLPDARGYRVGAGHGVPQPWLRSLAHHRSVPFEIWRQRCEYREITLEPAWREFVERVRDSPIDRSNADPRGATLPAVVRSLPIGDRGVCMGAIVLLYPGPAGNEHWENHLCVAVRLAQIAIEHRQFCDELDFRAHHDPLTGLPNRSLLDERLEGAIRRARLVDQRLALLYVDVDGFKPINDRFGHRTGDVLLNEIARRILSVLRVGDTVARIGGDEFNVLLPYIDSNASAGELASHLVESMRRPFIVDGHELSVTVSVGIAVYPDDGQNMADLQREADAAMYYAKSLGKNRTQNFSDNAATLDSVRMEQNLRRALEEGWFVVHYQPKFTAEGRLAGLEALVRLDHPSHGRILPGRFISIAETSGLIVPIGAWVLAEVCRQIAEWRRRDLAPVVVAVNVSAVQIARADFAKSVEECLAAHRVPPHCLELEVTESMVIDRESEEHRQMQLLRALGVFISIDDFGTGFSSLSYLNRLQIDAVKLDRSFVQSIDSDGGAQHVVRAMIAAARGLGLDVIAEGVETEEQRVQLVAAGCPVMQGYLFAYPGPPESIERLLRTDGTGEDLSRLHGALEAVADGGQRLDVQEIFIPV